MTRKKSMNGHRGFTVQGEYRGSRRWLTLFASSAFALGCSDSAPSTTASNGGVGASSPGGGAGAVASSIPIAPGVVRGSAAPGEKNASGGGAGATPGEALPNGLGGGEPSTQIPAAVTGGSSAGPLESNGDGQPITDGGSQSISGSGSQSISGSGSQSIAGRGNQPGTQAGAPPNDTGGGQGGTQPSTNGGSAPDGSGGTRFEVGGSNQEGGGEAGSLDPNPPAGETPWFLSDLCQSADSSNGWGPVERDQSNGEQAAGDGGPLTIDGETYSKGLGAHAPSDTGYRLGGQCSTFTAIVGVDDEMGSAGSVAFEVWGDGSQLYESPQLTGAGGGASVTVDVTGVQDLRLVVSDAGGNGSDHADWADAQVLCTAEPPSLCEVEDPDSETPTSEVPAGYHLVWADEFDVDGRPDPDNWGFEEGFVRNEEAQWYQEGNARVEAGFLIIEGRRERVTNPNYQAGSSSWQTNRQYAEYTSSSLRTMGKQTWLYGRFELRARIVASAGLWPAWWTLGESGEWPSNGEIDIMEYYNGRVLANVACGTSERWVAKWDGASREVSSFGSDWDARFHTWRMDWDDQTITLLLDGEVMNTTDLSDMLNPNGESPFRQPHYMLINLAIGGTAGGDPSGTEFPTRYEIDYVRVYQRD